MNLVDFTKVKSNFIRKFHYIAQSLESKFGTVKNLNPGT